LIISGGITDSATRVPQNVLVVVGLKQGSSLVKMGPNFQCVYSDPNEDCDRCQKHGAHCGSKIRTGDNLASGLQSLRVIPYPSQPKTTSSAESHPQPHIQSPPPRISNTFWSLDAPLLPRVFQQFNSDPATKFII